VVISPGYFELESTIQIGKTIKEVQEFFNPHLASGCRSDWPAHPRSTRCRPG
jgi:hypothetical protein